LLTILSSSKDASAVKFLKKYICLRSSVINKPLQALRLGAINFAEFDWKWPGTESNRGHEAESAKLSSDKER